MPPNWWDAPLILGGEEYLLERSDQAHTTQFVPTQPGDPGEEFAVRFENFAFGWGHSKYLERGHYDYGEPANLHRRLSWRPGAAVTNRTPGSAPNGPVSFVEYWDGTAANRRLIAISPRYIYEFDSAGSVDTVDMGAGYDGSTKSMTRGIRYKNQNLSAPEILIAVQGGATDYFVRRTASTPTYAATAANKVAVAIGEGKDPTNEAVVWRVDENGELNQLVAGGDPDSAGSWAGSTHPIGETSVLSNDFIQQAKRALVGRVDGIWSFDNVGKSVPVAALRNVLDDRNCMGMKDVNGMAVAPTIAGLIWVDGLEWGACGPISSNKEATGVSGREVAVSALAGEYLYSAVYDGSDSHIFLGTVRTETRTGSGHGPFIWHGPVAIVSGEEVTDLEVSTVWGKKLWIGTRTKIETLDLQDDFSPETDVASGYIYLPEGCLDDAGPEIMKEIHAAELVAPAANPFAASNAWAVEVDLGSGWESMGVANSGGSYSKQSFSTEKTSRRPLVRLAYTGNTGSAELETFVVTGLARPAGRWHHSFTIEVRQGQVTSRGKRTWLTPEGTEDTLRALVGPSGGWQGTVTWGETSFNGKVVSIEEIQQGRSNFLGPTKLFRLEIAEIA